MEDTEFRRAVVELRTAQKQYFLTRSPGDLRRAKDWEKKVDDMLAQPIADDKAKPEQPQQGDLFR